MRPFTIGDRVMIGNSIGTVVEKSMLVTKIRTLKNEEIRTPLPKTEDETPNSKNSESIETISTLRIAEAFEMEAQS